MPDKDGAFGEAYTSGTVTSGDAQGRKPTQVIPEIYVPLDTKRYGIGKPTRHVMKATIIHDQGKEAQ